MQITEKKVRDITRETIALLGPKAEPGLVKRIVKEVIRRLSEGGSSGTQPTIK